MRLPRRRLRTTRRLVRPGRPALPTGNPAPPSPTEVDLPSVLEGLPRPSTPEMRSQESTVEMMAVKEEIAVAPAAPVGPPRPPPQLEFACDCGATLLATPRTYDQHDRCPSCGSTMLLSLVYDGDRRSYEVVPFRVNPTSGP